MRTLALHHAYPMCFGGDARPSVDELWEMENKLHQTQQATESELGLERTQAAQDSTEPHVTGDEISIDSGPQRDAALFASRDCMELALFLRRIEHNEMLEPDEMNALHLKMGNCVIKGGRLMKALFGGQDAPFTFQGTLGGVKGSGHKVEWDRLDEMCSGVPDIALGTSSSGRSGAELLVHSGACLSQAGRTFHHIAGHGGIFTMSAVAAIPFACSISVDDLHSYMRQCRAHNLAAKFL